MSQHPACTAETRIRSKDCDVTIADRMGSHDAFPIPFPSFIYDCTEHVEVNHAPGSYAYIIRYCIRADFNMMVVLNIILSTKCQF